MARKAGRAPNLFRRGTFEAFVLGLKGTTLVYQWGDAAVAKVGGKIFAIQGGGVSGDPGGLSFKCSELAFEMLPEVAGVRPAPYLARAKWVAVAEGAALSPTEISGYLTEAHRLVAMRLPRRLKAELDLIELTAPRPDRF